MKWKDKLDPTLTKISVYVIVTVSILYLLYSFGNQVFVLIGLIGKLIASLFRLLSPLFWGFFVAYLLMPMADKIQKWIANSRLNTKKKSCRGIAVACTLLILAAVFVILLSVMISAFTSQVQIADTESTMEFLNSLSSNLQSLYEQVIRMLKAASIETSQFQEIANDLVAALTVWATDFGKGLVSTAQDIPSIFSQTLFIIMFAIWFLLDGTGIAMYWGRVMYALFSDETREKMRSFVDDVDRVFSGYIRGQMIDAIMMMVVISVTLSVIKVPFAVPIGILAGFGNLIPYVGPFIAYAGAIIVCLLSGDILKMILALALLWVVQTLDGSFINPKLLGSNVNIHPMYVVVALIVGGAWGGLLGMLFAVPIAALVKLQFDRRMDRKVLKKKQKEEHTV